MTPFWVNILAMLKLWIGFFAISIGQVFMTTCSATVNHVTYVKGQFLKVVQVRCRWIHARHKQPFSRVVVDLVGPLPVSNNGKRFILVLIDCATRYPDAVAIKNIYTTAIAEELVPIFSRVGIPDEMLSDTGTQFTSELIE